MKIKRGTKREDGMIFWAYNKKSKNGECWYSTEEFELLKRKTKHQGKKWKEENSDRVQSWGLKRYGITIQVYNAILHSQNGCCAICGTTRCLSGNNLCVDHCHKTGRVRGLLCRKCNSGIGQLEDSTALLKKAIEYIESAKRVDC